MPASKAELFARYQQLANRLQQHLLDINDMEATQRLTSMSEDQFNVLCESANSDPVVRDWLYCIEHGYPSERRLRLDAA